MYRLITIKAALIGLLILLPNCETSSGLGPEGSGTDETGEGDADADTDDDGDWDGDIPGDPDLCIKTCEEAADCVEPGADLLHDEDNFTCEDGLCVYQDCISSSECDEVYPGLGFSCEDVGCAESCDSPSDCAIPLEPFWDEDNWTCNDNICTYLGCISDIECSQAMGQMYSCQDVMSSGVPVCHLKCEDRNDCVTQIGHSGYDEDNYECIKDKCYYIGCKSDEECGEGFRCVSP